MIESPNAAEEESDWSSVGDTSNSESETDRYVHVGFSDRRKINFLIVQYLHHQILFIRIFILVRLTHLTISESISKAFETLFQIMTRIVLQILYLFIVSIYSYLNLDNMPKFINDHGVI